MLRSMFSAISGLRSHQTMMDVVGNNIANVNTVGYKSSRATFAESLTQVERGATSPVAGASGGVNPYQIGLGVNVAGIDMIYSQGSLQVTGRRSDIAINGDGFLVTGDPGGPDYTRAGALSWDASGNLVTADGTLVLGIQGNEGVAVATPDPLTIATDTGPINLSDGLTAAELGAGDKVSDPTIASDGTVTARANDGTLRIVGRILLARFDNPEGLVRQGGGMFGESPNSGNAIIGDPDTQGLGFLQAGTVEMSNVDLAGEFTNMIIAQRGLQANSRTITSSDEILQELVNLKR